MNILHGLLVGVGVWFGACVAASAAWCVLIEGFGTRDCNGPALRAERRAERARTSSRQSRESHAFF